MYKKEIGPPKTSSSATHNATATAASAPSSAQSTPTPITQFAPPSPFPIGGQQPRSSVGSFAAPSPPAATSFTSQRPHSPARSNSTSSIATQSSAVPSSSVVNNPPLISGNVPGIAATNSGKVTGVPMTTPPETPKGATNSVTGTKRDASESEREDSKEPKKRRIAPTQVKSDSHP